MKFHNPVLWQEVRVISDKFTDGKVDGRDFSNGPFIHRQREYGPVIIYVMYIYRYLQHAL